MKSIFTILIALNIAAFGYFFLQQNQDNAQPNTENIKSVAVTSAPASSHSAPLLISTSEVLDNLETATPEISSDTPTESKEKELCLATIEVDEKTYLSLKKSLEPMTHQAKRIEKKNPPQTTQNTTLYWVHVPINDTSKEQLADLKEKGFDTHLMGQDISLGLFRNPSGAAHTKQQAFNAGYTQVTITEKPSKTKIIETDTAAKSIFYRLSFSPFLPTQKNKNIINKHKLKIISCP